MKGWFGRWAGFGQTAKICETKERRFNIIVNCDTCARDGHGPYYEQCRDDVKEWDRLGVRCWRPRGTILIWDEKIC